MNNSPLVETIVNVVSEDQEVDHAWISLIFGTEPSFSRNLSHLTSSGHMSPVRQSLWELRLGELVVDSLDQALHAQLGTLGAGADLVAERCNERGWAMSVLQRVRIFDWGDRPALELSRESLQRLSELNAAWALEIVDLSRE
jgi:hypothetical protein